MWTEFERIPDEPKKAIDVHEFDPYNAAARRHLEKEKTKQIIIGYTDMGRVIIASSVELDTASKIENLTSQSEQVEQEV